MQHLQPLAHYTLTFVTFLKATIKIYDAFKKYLFKGKVFKYRISSEM